MAAPKDSLQEARMTASRRRFIGRSHQSPNGEPAVLAPTDGSVVARCQHIVKSLGGSVRSFSVGERAQIPDVPDLRLYLRGQAVWWEAKQMGESYGGKGKRDERGDRLSQGQIDFLRQEYEAGQIVGAGDSDALKRVLLDAPSNWRAAGWSEVGVVLLRGVRP